MCLHCQSNTVPFSKQSNSIDTNIFPDENLNSIFTECNLIETSFNDSNHPVSIDSKYYDINDFGKLNRNKNSSFVTLHLTTASLWKNVDDLQNFLSLLKYSFDIAEISEHKIVKTQ